MPMKVYDQGAHCAVKGCERKPYPEVCPYDGRRHHHGCIHYEFSGEAGLEFHQDHWMWVCMKHHADLCENLKKQGRGYFGDDYGPRK